jgi:hypothetical protein
MKKKKKEKEYEEKEEKKNKKKKKKEKEEKRKRRRKRRKKKKKKKNKSKTTRKRKSHFDLIKISTTKVFPEFKNFSTLKVADIWGKFMRRGCARLTGFCRLPAAPDSFRSARPQRSNTATIPTLLLRL